VVPGTDGSRSRSSSSTSLRSSIVTSASGGISCSKCIKILSVRKRTRLILSSISDNQVNPRMFRRNSSHKMTLFCQRMEARMGFGKGALLWLIGIPLPIILLLAFFWH
jgi:hypothetical protein